MLLPPDNEGTLAAGGGEPEGARSGEPTATPGSGAAVTTDTNTEIQQPTLESLQAELNKTRGEVGYLRKTQTKYQELKTKYESLAKTQPVSGIGSDLTPKPAERDPEAPITLDDIKAQAKEAALEAARELADQNSQVNTESEFYDYCAKEHQIDADEARDLLLESVRFKNSHTQAGIAALRKEGLAPMSLAEQANFVKAAVRGLHGEEREKAAEQKGYKAGYDVGIGKVKGSPPHGGDAPPRQVSTGVEATGVLADIADSMNRF